MKHLVVSLHDFHPGSLDLIGRQVEELAAWGVGQTSILVVPHFHRERTTASDPASLAFLERCASGGHDLVLHGYYHQQAGHELATLFWSAFYTSGECEFVDLSEGEAKHRIEWGRRLWDERGWPLHGFIAPAWLMPEKHDHLLRRLGFLYTTRLRAFKVLPKALEVASQSLCYSTRSWWRRSASFQWNPVLFSRLRGKPLLRLSLHPRDLEYPELRMQIREIVEMALADGYQPITYAAYAQM
ncbi:MAG: polysaccharide deacetylase family protein [Candidatus Methylacidiphilales bacterium]|nr:polysaccharide deacetylase family protein [Candidatus Methylacidiphilales bacterium]